MDTHKLADGPLTMTVTAATLTESQKFKGSWQYEVQGTAGGRPVRTYVSQKAYEQQLSRLGLTPDTAVGQSLRFEQISKDGTRYTNIYKATAEAAEAPAAAPQQAAPAKMTPQEAGSLYHQCLSQAFMALGGMCDENGIALTAEALQSAAATIFIKVTR